MRDAGVVAVVVALLSSAPALAGHDVQRTIEFLGFSADASRFLLKVSDADAGDFLSLRSFATGKQEKAYPIERKKDEKKLVEDARRQHRIDDKGVEGPAAPDGRHALAGVSKGERFLLNVVRGEKTARFQELRLESGRSGPARMTLKTAYWSKDGHRVVVILHRKLVDENGIDADEARPYPFFAGELNFR
jgi:hypothetical protein